MGSNVISLRENDWSRQSMLGSELCWFTSVCAASEDGPVVLRNICNLLLLSAFSLTCAVHSLYCMFVHVIGLSVCYTSNVSFIPDLGSPITLTAR